MAHKFYEDVLIPIERNNITKDSIMTKKDINASIDSNLSIPSGQTTITDLTNPEDLFSTNNIKVFSVNCTMTQNASVPARNPSSYAFFDLDGKLNFYILRTFSNSTEIGYRIYVSPPLINPPNNQNVSICMKIDRYRGSNTPSFYSAQRPNAKEFSNTLGGNQQWWDENRCWIQLGGDTSATGNAASITNAQAANAELYKIDLVRNYDGRFGPVPSRYDITMQFYNTADRFIISFRRLA